MIQSIKAIRTKYAGKRFVLFAILAGMLVITYGITIVMYMFRDSTSLTVWSVEFWDVLFYRKMNGFYEYVQMNLRGAPHEILEGSWLSILPLAIWNFPLWLTHRDPAATDITGSVCNAWAKLFYLVCFIILCIYVYRTVMLITDNSIESSLFAVMLTAGSLEIFASVAFAGQDEVVYMLCLVMSLYYRLKGRNITSLVWAIVTVSLCSLMIIPFVVMELFFDKKIWSTLIKSVVVLLPTVAFELAYAQDSLYQAAKEFNSRGVFQLMMNTGSVVTTMGNTSIPAILLIIVVFATYVNRDKENKSRVLLFMGLTMAIMSFLMYSLFYRYWLYVPFVAMYAAVNSDSRAMKLLLMLLASVSRFLGSFTYPDLYSYFYYSPIAQRLFADKGTFIEPANTTYDTIRYIINPLSIACVLLVLFIAYNKNKREYKLVISEKILAPIYLGSSSLFMIIYFIWVLFMK